MKARMRHGGNSPCILRRVEVSSHSHTTITSPLLERAIGCHWTRGCLYPAEVSSLSLHTETTESSATDISLELLQSSATAHLPVPWCCLPILFTWITAVKSSYRSLATSAGLDTGLEGTGKEYNSSREGKFSSAVFPTAH
jgi:hypothetical protein